MSDIPFGLEEWTADSKPGIIARNPHTGLEEPYTGRLPIGDFIDDLMVPQMERQGRQVTINDRCGSPWALNFDKPEYATFNVPQRRKWESNQSMDPYSYLQPGDQG
ncbi:putative tissue alpha-l-fucosidase protein [Emericellopsis cladophorae]|uniref:Tissue alpha-l-fucosidase protein n=1 Tax=Emericellopsis cladophorae TaxID=2686198 RepID=A0A9Q0BBA3_9HYPO|nr:putative tissue alpha-l-fucosidase protein [Emericellopsis cladophorae]KAI6777844.1 putative tissue alpha-l-fucosidase protein [Emericellopsis cladophorae]